MYGVISESRVLLISLAPSGRTAHSLNGVNLEMRAPFPGIVILTRNASLERDAHSAEIVILEGGVPSRIKAHMSEITPILFSWDLPSKMIEIFTFSTLRTGYMSGVVII